MIIIQKGMSSRLSFECSCLSASYYFPYRLKTLNIYNSSKYFLHNYIPRFIYIFAMEE